MKRTLLATLAMALMVPVLASAKKPVVASGQGYLLFREVGGYCQVAVTDLDLDLTNVPTNTPVKVKWSIDSSCVDPYKVAIGRFKTKNGNVWPVFDCGPGVTSGYVECKYNWDCKDKAYNFTVCVDGAKVVDPELRIKGTRGGPAGKGCPKKTPAEAAATCEGASQ